VFKVHFNDGTTRRIDLTDEEAARVWMRESSDPAFQARITGLTIERDGVTYSLPRPRDLRPDEVRLFVEDVPRDERVKGGERIVCTAGELRISLMVHAERRAARVDVSRDGRLRYSPKRG